MNCSWKKRGGIKFFTPRGNIFWVLLFPAVFSAQNLVQNGDFEEYSEIPSDYAKTSYAIGWSNSKSAESTTSPEYFHTSGSMPTYFGQIKPQSGNGQMGLTTWHASMEQFREYISSRLISPMAVGAKYKVSFYLSNGNENTYSFKTANFGVHFSTTPVLQYGSEPLKAEPQFEITEEIVIENGWKKFSFIYVATDTMSYITFGNFRNDSKTTRTSTGSNGAYYFIDNIEVIGPAGKTKKTVAENVVQVQNTGGSESQKYDATNKSGDSFPVKEKIRIK